MKILQWHQYGEKYIKWQVYIWQKSDPGSIIGGNAIVDPIKVATKLVEHFSNISMVGHLSSELHNLNERPEE